MKEGDEIIKKKLALFGHFCIILGCYLVALGIYLMPESEPTFVEILTKPLFWGLFSIFGGVCANVHAYCRCIQRQKCLSTKKKTAQQ